MISTYLSDLFFNHDNSQAQKPEHLGGGYDPDLLVESAEEFLEMAQGFAREIGCPTGAVFPPAEKLAEDFLDRI